MDKNRRVFLRMTARTLMVAPVLAVGIPARGRAQDEPHLEEDDPTAMALGYKHDAAEVDPAKYPKYQEGQICGNCNLIQSDSGQWRPCSIFPGKLVNTDGWCNAYVPKAG